MPKVKGVPRPIDPPFGSCDWGGCEAIAIDWRCDNKLGWLPVCEAHSRGGKSAKGSTMTIMDRLVIQRCSNGYTIQPGSRDPGLLPEFTAVAMDADGLAEHVKKWAIAVEKAPSPNETGAE